MTFSIYGKMSKTQLTQVATRSSVHASRNWQDPELFQMMTTYFQLWIKISPFISLFLPLKKQPVPVPVSDQALANQGDRSNLKELLNSIHSSVNWCIVFQLPAYALHVVSDKFDIYKERNDRIQELAY